VKLSRNLLERSTLAEMGVHWEFYAYGDGVWFGPLPTGGRPLDLISTKHPELDNLQILEVMSYLSRVGRDDEAVRAFALQARCSLAQARAFYDDKGADPGKKFTAPPWQLLTEEQGRADEKRARRMRAYVRASIAAVLGVIIFVLVAFVL